MLQPPWHCASAMARDTVIGCVTASKTTPSLREHVLEAGTVSVGLCVQAPEEVIELPGHCMACNGEAQTRIFKTSIPYFKVCPSNPTFCMGHRNPNTPAFCMGRRNFLLLHSAWDAETLPLRQPAWDTKGGAATQTCSLHTDIVNNSVSQDAICRTCQHGLSNLHHGLSTGSTLSPMWNVDSRAAGQSL